MPYILKADRPQYDIFIPKLVEAIYILDYSTIENLRDDLINVLCATPTTVVDGHLNYFITKLFKGMKWIGKDSVKEGNAYYKEIYNFLFDVLLAVYPPKYFNYNRLEGLLYCCRKEFERRYGYLAPKPSILLLNLADKLYDSIIVPYEDEKIKLNGDV